MYENACVALPVVFFFFFKPQGNGVVKGKSLLESCRLVQDIRDGTLNLPWSGQVDKT